MNSITILAITASIETLILFYMWTETMQDRRNAAKAKRWATGGPSGPRWSGTSERVRKYFAEHGVAPEPNSPMMDLLVIYEELLPLDDELARYLRQTIVAVHEVAPFASCKT